MKTHYETLGVSEDASQEAIKRGFRKEALKNHPDKNGNTQEAQDKMKDINNAFDVLKDEKSRANYDKFELPGIKAKQANGQQKAEESNASDSFNIPSTPGMERNGSQQKEEEQGKGEEQAKKATASPTPKPDDNKKKKDEEEEEEKKKGSEQKKTPNIFRDLERDGKKAKEAITGFIGKIGANLDFEKGASAGKDEKDNKDSKEEKKEVKNITTPRLGG